QYVALGSLVVSDSELRQPTGYPKPLAPNTPAVQGTLSRPSAGAEAVACSHPGDQLFHPLVDRAERVLAQDRPLGLIVQFEMDPVHREVAPALLRAPDELAAQPRPGRLRRHRLG